MSNYVILCNSYIPIIVITSSIRTPIHEMVSLASLTVGIRPAFGTEKSWRGQNKTSRIVPNKNKTNTNKNDYWCCYSDHYKIRSFLAHPIYIVKWEWKYNWGIFVIACFQLAPFIKILFQIFNIINVIFMKLAAIYTFVIIMIWISHAGSIIKAVIIRFYFWIRDLFIIKWYKRL